MDQAIEILEPKEGMPREIGFYVASMEHVREDLVGLVSDMSRDELAMRISPSFHQIGGLILHLGESEFWWIEARAAGKEISDEERKFAHIDDTTESDFALKGYDARLHRCPSEHSRPLCGDFSGL